MQDITKWKEWAQSEYETIETWLKILIYYVPADLKVIDENFEWFQMLIEPNIKLNYLWCLANEPYSHTDPYFVCTYITIDFTVLVFVKNSRSDQLIILDVQFEMVTFPHFSVSALFRTNFIGPSVNRYSELSNGILLTAISYRHLRYLFIYMISKCRPS